MKKTIFGRAGIALIAASALLLGACKKDAEDTGKIETYSLEALNISAKAYPGFNYIAWGELSTKDTSYKIIRDDGFDVTAALSSVSDPSLAGEHFYIDTDIQDGVTYTYTCYVIPNGSEVEASGSTYAIALKGTTKSASAKAIKPNFYNDKGELVYALDLPAYEKDGNKNYILNEKNLYLKLNADGKLCVTFPTKAYLNYSFDLVNENALDVFGRVSAPAVNTLNSDSVDGVKNFYKMDGTYKWNTNVTSAGVYKVIVAVSDFANAYETSYVTSEASVEIAPLDVSSATSIVTANYIDAGKTIRIVWKAAKKSNEEKWAAENYKVYYLNNYRYTDTQAEIKADTQAGETVYYVEFPVTDNTRSYDFYVVLSDNGKVEDNTSSPKTVSVTAYGKLGYADSANVSEVTANFAELDDDALTNDAYISFTNVPEAVSVSSIKYKIVEKNTNTDTYKWTVDALLLDSELKEAVIVPVDYTNYLATVKNVAIDAKVIFLYTLKEAGKEDRFGIISTGSLDITTNTVINTYSSFTSPVIGPTEFNFFYTDAEQTKGTFTIVVDGNNETEALSNYNNYSYEIYYARLAETYSVKDFESITTEWVKVPVTIAWNDANLDFEGTSNEVAFTINTPVYDNYLKNEDGSKVLVGYSASYVFKYVKTNKNAPTSAKGVSTVAYSAVQDLTKAK